LAAEDSAAQDLQSDWRKIIFVLNADTRRQNKFFKLKIDLIILRAQRRQYLTTGEKQK